MERYLMRLEVSQKQAYIFGSRELKENIARSAEIRFVTSPAFFEAVCPQTYSSENLVYSGGGHTVLQFDTQEGAEAFSRELTLRVLRDFPKMELFVKIQQYDSTKTPGDNLNGLAAALEAKKARRTASFHRKAFGVEHPKQPAEFRTQDYDIPQLQVRVPEGWTLTADGTKLAGDGNFLAVVHADGNAMGRRVQQVYESCRDSWDSCVKQLKEFSDRIKKDFDAAYDEMTEELVKALPASGYEASQQNGKRILPVRKVVGAGDDVCFIAAGKLGLECAASFLAHLSAKGYAACAGVVLIHTKYPFRQAYDLSEELCSNAKKFGARLEKWDGIPPEERGSVSAIDWHIEYGQLKGSLSQIRGDYQTEDGGRLELRPLVVLPGRTESCPPERSYSFFTELCRQLSPQQAGLARSKLKELRNAFRMGEIETQFALRQTQTEELLWKGIENRFPDFAQRIIAGEHLRAAFVTDDSDPEQPVQRCLYFDAIELSDQLTLWRGDLS